MFSFVILSLSLIVHFSYAIPVHVHNDVVTLNLTELKKIGIDANNLLVNIKRLSDGDASCPELRPTDYKMRLFKIRHTKAVCNDGSKAGYYLLKNSDPKKWIVFLQGGWFCIDEESCEKRQEASPQFSGSASWPPLKTGTGILSTNPDENPLFFDANIVYVPYCSSDSWSGRKFSTKSFSFMGSVILAKLFRDLSELHNLKSATRIYLSGSSAGATGVLMNIDRISQRLINLAPKAKVRGIIDSGWYLDNMPFKRESDCRDNPLHCSPSKAISIGFKYWKGVVPYNCAKQFGSEEAWKCYFGHRVYPTLKTPIFIIQNLFDEAQLMANRVYPPANDRQRRFMLDIGQDFIRTLSNVSAVFAPSCVSHQVLQKPDWFKLTVRRTSLLQALKCWTEGDAEQNRYGTRMKKNFRSTLGKRDFFLTGEKLMKDDPRAIRASAPSNKRKILRIFDLKRCRRLKRKNRRKPKSKRKRIICTSQRERGRRALSSSSHEVHNMAVHGSKCGHYLIDVCNVPQCNPSCPDIFNHVTGNAVQFNLSEEY
ncbi:DgyrCDS88 [Dimorphilus gyrociliatus]|nr:DgyrCDS88 [Dimorphilus gyrociliatus]